MGSFHPTPLQWFTILVPLLMIPIILLRWLGQRGKPAPVRTYNQGCLAGALTGIIIGIWIGAVIGFYFGFRIAIPH